MRPNLQDIGAATLALQVRDIEKVLAKVKASGATIVTIGGAPVNPTGNSEQQISRDRGSRSRRLLRRIAAARSAALATRRRHSRRRRAVLDRGFGEDSRLPARCDRIQRRPTGPLGTNATVANLIGLPTAQWRITHGSIPGTTLDFGLIEYSGVPRAKVVAGAEDPGSPAFTMVVRDVNAAVDQWTKAGGTVATTGGKAIVRANGAGNVFVRDVNGFMWELIQRAAQ